MVESDNYDDYVKLKNENEKLKKNLEKLLTTNTIVIGNLENDHDMALKNEMLREENKRLKLEKEHLKTGLNKFTKGQYLQSELLMNTMMNMDISGIGFLVYDGNPTWETSFIVQAYCSTGLINEIDSTLRKAHEFIKSSQIRENHPDYKTYYRHKSKGSWTLSTADNGWSVSDCTAEALKALLLLSNISPDLVGEPIEGQSLYDAVDCLLSYVNNDGTFSTYECKRTTPLLEVLNPSESFKNIVVDYPSVECTSSVLQALIMFRDLDHGYRKEEIRNCIESASKFIEKEQREDGSWFGSWGICFTYGTFFAIKGLAVSGRTYENSDTIRKACSFLLSKQLHTGGWGETYLSSETEEYVDASRPHAVNTAWAMLTLVYGGQVERDPAPLYKAAKVLINMQLESGDFPQQEHIGCFNSSLYFNYGNHRNLYPIWALGEFRQRLLARKK
ncbi:achilleol B synthase-like [Miscanthus floridulus]|uniref:achilleol B synthase-like n=1 Tax=Miscanthus floridulus TaxID=154761 RepID=UPI0034592286